MLLYVRVHTPLNSLVRLIAYIDPFRFRGVFHFTLSTALLQLSQPFILTSMLFLTFYWYELETRNVLLGKKSY